MQISTAESIELDGVEGVSLNSGSGSVEAYGVSGVVLSSYLGGVTLHAGGQNKIIQVGDSNTAYKEVDLSNYPINWKAIQKVTSNSMLILRERTAPLLT